MQARGGHCRQVCFNVKSCRPTCSRHQQQEVLTRSRGAGQWQDNGGLAGQCPCQCALTGQPWAGVVRHRANGWSDPRACPVHGCHCLCRMLRDDDSLQLAGFHFTRAHLNAMPDPEEAHARRGAPWTFDAQRFVAAIQQIRASGMLEGHCRTCSCKALFTEYPGVSLRPGRLLQARATSHPSIMQGVTLWRMISQSACSTGWSL